MVGEGRLVERGKGGRKYWRRDGEEVDGGKGNGERSLRRFEGEANEANGSEHNVNAVNGTGSRSTATSTNNHSASEQERGPVLLDSRRTT